jgi:2-oxo-4-hydroxy-4-carboxy-5-ureidoimidazoline decarboxylase
MSQKPLEELNACTQADFVAALANIFEYSPWVAEQAVAALCRRQCAVCGDEDGG